MSIQHSYDVAAVGTERLISATNTVRSIRIDNPSGMWLQVLETTVQYIPPSTIGWVQNVVPPTNTINLKYITALIGGVASAVTGGPITVTLYEVEQRTSYGIAYTAASATDVTAVTTAVNIVAANQAAQATAAAQATELTKLTEIDTAVDTGNAAQATATKQDIAQTSLNQILINTQPINNALVNATVSVGTVATLIRTAVGKEVVGIYNSSATATVSVGPSTVTTATGFPVLPGEKLAVALDSQSIYGIVTSGTVTIYLIRGTLT